MHMYQSSSNWGWWGWSQYPSTWLQPAAAPPSHQPQPPCPHMPEHAAHPLLPPRRPCKAASEHCLPIGISAALLAPVHYLGHEHCMPHQPGNVYGDDCHPVQQLKNIKRDKASAPSNLGFQDPSLMLHLLTSQYLTWLLLTSLRMK